MNTLIHKETNDEHLQIIRQVAVKLHKKYNLDVEDLYSEGTLQYLLKKDKIVAKENAKFNTCLWIVVWNSLLDYIRMEMRVRFVMSIDTFLDMEEYPDTPRYTKHPLKESFLYGCF